MTYFYCVFQWYWNFWHLLAFFMVEGEGRSTACSKDQILWNRRD